MPPHPRQPLRTVFLTGFMGAGKSRLGRALSQELGWHFVDLDAEIERRTGRTVPQLFEDGEDRFRREEAAALRSICAPADEGAGAEPAAGSLDARPAGRIVALGGGTLSDADSRRLVAENGLLVYLKTDVGVLVRRLQASDPERPMLTGVEEGDLHQRILELLEDRRPYYEAASVIVDCGDDRPLAGIIKELIHALDI